MPVLEAKQLVKKYRNRVVVNDVSIRIEPGEAVGLLGPNGAGKTTSFYMIVGLISPDSGAISIDGNDLTSAAMHVRARQGIGYLPQEASVFRKLSVQDNILAILQTRADLGIQGQQSRLEDLLDELNIEHLRDMSGMSLSGGERRRVEIARALAAEPKFILLDEPFAGVDPISVIDIQNIIKQLCDKNIGVLITDHNVRETLGICNRAYILNNGQVIAEGSSEQILANPEVREVYLGKNFSM